LRDHQRDIRSLAVGHQHRCEAGGEGKRLPRSLRIPGADQDPGQQQNSVRGWLRQIMPGRPSRWELLVRSSQRKWHPVRWLGGVTYAHEQRGR